MAIQIALNHKSHYQFDQFVELGPHVVRLRPAPHCRTPIHSYSLNVTPARHFVNWQQDPHGNFLARLVFPEPTDTFTVEVDLRAELQIMNPFDFFLEPSCTEYPFRYEAALQKDLRAFLQKESGNVLTRFVSSLDLSASKTMDFLVSINQQLAREIEYEVRLEPGVQSCEQTLNRQAGSCRDSAWLLVQVLRHLGLAARFVSGYLIQLTAEDDSTDEQAGRKSDFTDLHAWAEAYLPGAGWVGLDPTSGLLAAEGHLPLSCSPEPTSAAPITGTVSECQAKFGYSMSVTRIGDEPPTARPYTDEQWRQINAVGQAIDTRLESSDVRLTMGGEPTFVAMDDRVGEEWKTDALGPTKRQFARSLLQRLRRRFATGALLHDGIGKWYPGETAARWAMRCFWRTDGEPVWRNDKLLADESTEYRFTHDDAKVFTKELALRLGVDPDHIVSAHEDAMYYVWKERHLPRNVGPLATNLDDDDEREQIARVFERGLNSPVGCVLPLRYQWWLEAPCWSSGLWKLRADELLLIPGSSPMGLRLPLKSLAWNPNLEHEPLCFPLDPMTERRQLPAYETLREDVRRRYAQEPSVGRSMSNERLHKTTVGVGTRQTVSVASRLIGDELTSCSYPPDSERDGPTGDIVRTALCVEPRDGRLFVFIPPIDRLEQYLDLVAVVEDTAEELQIPITLEGYLPPHDHRMRLIKITPDPGVIEVNMHPTHSWNELVEVTTGIYEDAKSSRLCTEKFDLDGSQVATGGGNHVVLGGPTAAESPFLHRPSLLRSLIAYWHNHPSLSYLFAGRFIGPTSQAPRVDETRRDAVYELQTAFEQIPDGGQCPPWIVDRVFRNLLVDCTGNTHRAEFCVDKLYSPDASTGRLGLVELRAFEMPPDSKMCLVLQLLIRGLVARFWDCPYRVRLVDWGTALHDRFMLPHFVWQDFQEVLEEMRQSGWDFSDDWFSPHHEFRFPQIGEFSKSGIHVELRRALEPWYVLGEEQGEGQMVRPVDSSVERFEVRVQGMTDSRHMITCNGRKLPLHPTGTSGEFVAGVRFRAWKLANCLHPTIPVDQPLVFDLLDTWSERSLGGCKYHVDHPGGLNPDSPPINGNDAESRRSSRFSLIGHTGGKMTIPVDEPNRDYPLTLDLRRGKSVHRS